MLHAIRKWAVLLGLLAAVALPAGCNQKKLVNVTGSVLRNGQPLVCSPTGHVMITIVPDVGGDEQYTTRVAYCEKDGSFTIPQVMPGKYRIGVEQPDPNPQTDKLNAVYRAGDSKVVREVDGKTPLNIDLANFK